VKTKPPINADTVIATAIDTTQSFFALIEYNAPVSTSTMATATYETTQESRLGVLASVGVGGRR
jgi:hypothetical protein